MIAGCWKKPFPGLGIATGLFAVYCVMDWTFSAATAPPLLKTAHKPKFAFEDAGDLGAVYQESSDGTDYEGWDGNEDSDGAVAGGAARDREAESSCSNTGSDRIYDSD